MDILALKKRHAATLEKAESILNTAKNASRDLTENEISDINTCTTEATAIEAQIKAAESVSTLRSRMFPNGSRTPVLSAPESEAAPSVFGRARWQCVKYAEAFATFMRSKGNVRPEALALGEDGNGGYFVPTMSAASYEGGSTSGAPIVPSVVEQTIIPLAAPQMALRSLSMVIPTTMDIKLPRKTAHGTAATKAESGSSNNAFAGTDPTMEQFTLTANMIGHTADISWELAQDVPAFLAYLQEDELLSIAELEESKFVGGSGSGEPEGIKGNVATGVTGVLVGTDNYAEELLEATYDVQGLLNPVYENGASWVMTKATGIVLRKQQFIDNKFNPVWVRNGNQDFFHGYPVAYSAQVDSIGSAAVPVYFGNFKAGYIIGDRGGSGISVKILDQPKAQYGLLTVLSYRRVDGKVRRSEAIQPITLHV